MVIAFNIPVFTGKEDPNHWIFRLEKIAKVNKWGDDEKLVYADNFLSESLQLWSMERQFQNFEQFKVEFIAKHTKKVNLNKVVSDITTFKMRQGEKIKDYIKRFEVKRNAYQIEVLKRKLANADPNPNTSGAGGSSSSGDPKSSGTPGGGSPTATEAKVVSKFLYKDIFCVFGPPTHILTDNGSSFDNEIVDGLVALVQVNHQFTAPYRPSTNGRTEQLNGTIMAAIKKLCMENPRDWDQQIDAVLYALRTKVHSTLGISPYEFLFGLSPPSVRQDPLQMMGRKLGFERLVEINDRNLQVEDYNVLNNDLEYDIKPMVPRKRFAPGTHVVRVRHNKFSKMDSTYKPEVFTVVASFANGTCQLADQAGRLLKRRVNIGSLRKIHFR